MRNPALLPLLVVLAAAAPAQSRYVRDVAFALDAIEEKCEILIRSKDIDWKRVRREFTKEARRVKKDEDHLVLLVRLLARLRDGHARVRPLPAGEDVKWPAGGEAPLGSPGMSWFETGGKYYVREVWDDAKGAGVRPGMEVVAVDGVKTSKWLERRIAELYDTRSFSTVQHAAHVAMGAGLGAPRGTRYELALKPPAGRRIKRTVTCGRARSHQLGPVAPTGLTPGKNISWRTTDSGHLYLWVSRSRREVVSELDAVLTKAGPVAGVILDYRGNLGGSFDHDAFLGRFIPAGRSLRFSGNERRSAGPAQFGGPVVVIVNGACVSAGETGSGMFKEEGRAYVIGESPTAGMSSQKTTIDLPSGLFQLYVSTHSNKAWFNGGKGIEGLGVPPHEIVELDPEDVARGVDTLIARAEALFAKWPENAVPYVPKRYGWKRPK